MNSSYSFLTSALDRMSGQRHAPAALYPRGKDPGVHWTGGWVGLELAWTQIVSDGIASDYRLDYQGSIPCRGKVFVSRPVLRPTQSPIEWVPGGLSRGVKRGWGVMLTIHTVYCQGQEWVGAILHSSLALHMVSRAALLLSSRMALGLFRRGCATTTLY
jgi:hypothetical protein